MDDLVYGWTVTGTHPAQRIENGSQDAVSAGDFTWLHLDSRNEGAQDILARHVGEDEYILESLTSKSTRPRCEKYKNGILLNLRGVNLNPGSNPEDMISARLWVCDGLNISIRARPMLAFSDLDKALARHEVALTPSDILAFIVDRLTHRMSFVLEEIDERVSQYEDNFDAQQNELTPRELAATRQEIARIKRHLSPQKSALMSLSTLNSDLLTEEFKNVIRQNLDIVSRYIEELDELKERSLILLDMSNQYSSQKIEKITYALTVCAGIFLPLGFLTGLLGINVGGMPGTEDKSAFWLASALMAVILLAEVVYFKWRKWI